MTTIAHRYHSFRDATLGRLQSLDFLAPLLIRLYLVPIFWMAGSKKIDFSTLMPYESTVSWFGSPDFGLGLPAPFLMAFLAGWTEVLGAVFLALGFAVRWISLPLIFTMIVAMGTAHWDNGWQAITDPGAPFANERVEQASERLDRAKEILREHGNYSWLTEKGSVVMLNNGIEFAATYLILLVSLLFSGAGRFVSVDYYLARASRLPAVGYTSYR